jgi:hypothetical protein
MTGKPPKGAISPMKFFAKLVWLDGRPLLEVIEPYRMAIFNSVLWTFDENGRPEINMALCGRAKKCWKTLDLCIAALYRLCVWPSPWGNDCAIIASDLDQAGDDLSLIKKLIDKNPILANLLEVRVREIIRKDTGAKLQILPAQDASGLHGKTFCLLGIDELHTQIDYATVEALAQDPLRADTSPGWRAIRRWWPAPARRWWITWSWAGAAKTSGFISAGTTRRGRPIRRFATRA